jgi:plasmid stabilization system protein ParE
MSRKLIVRPQARLELAEASDWYDGQDKGLGDELLRAVEASIQKIMRNPFQYQRMYRSARRARLRKFPYGLIYTVTDDEIIIMSCVHGRRDRKRWRSRIR